MSAAMSVSGFIVGFTKGWQLSLCLIAIGPPIGVVMYFVNKLQSSSMHENHLAYSQSAGYAEQALSSIKVVAAFGREKDEKDNYLKFLGDSKE